GRDLGARAARPLLALANAVLGDRYAVERSARAGPEHHRPTVQATGALSPQQGRRSLVVGRRYEEQNQADDRRLTTDAWLQRSGFLNLSERATLSGAMADGAIDWGAWTALLSEIVTADANV